MKQKHFVKCCGEFLCVKEIKRYKRIATKIKGYSIDCSCKKRENSSLYNSNWIKVIEIQAKDLALYTHWPVHTKEFWDLLNET
jgi:hypothetical protein